MKISFCIDAAYSETGELEDIGLELYHLVVPPRVGDYVCLDRWDKEKRKHNADYEVIEVDWFVFDEKIEVSIKVRPHKANTE